MIAKAHERDLLTTPYVFDPAEAVAMARAGADVLVCHFGLTVGGSIGAATSTKLEDCLALTDVMAEAARAVNRDVLILVHGGPIAEPADAEYVLARARHCDGFYGASSMERLPVERALSVQVAKFKSIRKTVNQSEEQARGRPHGRRAGRE
jgi:predicted TIM-barrel enzyme